MNTVPIALGTAVVCASLLVARPANSISVFEAEKPHTASKLIRVSGGGAALSAIFRPVHESFENDAGIDLALTASSPGQGLIDLIQGRADVATSIVSLEEMVKAAAGAGAKVDPSSLKTTVLGKNRTLVFLHKANAVSALSKEQLKEIFTGKITNWKDVGGSDSEIVVVWGAKTLGQNSLFSHLILDDEAVTAKASLATDYRDIINKVVAEPRAIAIDPVEFSSGSTHVPKTPKVTSAIIAVTQGTPSPDVQTLFDFLAKVEAEF